jgi:hypothetical protein
MQIENVVGGEIHLDAANAHQMLADMSAWVARLDQLIAVTRKS